MAALARAVRKGDRRALGRAITLAESGREDHRAQAEQLLEALLPHRVDSIRVGISGVPGVGKSTLIETLGRHVIDNGKRVAVLAVDPSSKLSGGSILGDKTRMETLSREANAFIRPSPAGVTLGGVARRTREAISICEAAAYDLVIVETVGVGQSETAVKDMTDMFVLLLSPAGGDELQGMKKGIVELADMILVNKADGEFEMSARHAVSDYRSAIHLLRPASPNWQVPVAACSALTGMGIDEAWSQIEAYAQALGDSGEIAAQRSDQARAWMWSEVSDSLLDRLRGHPDVRAILTTLEDQVVAGKTTPAAAARRILKAFLSE
ncbi:MAG: methylmalonyl Co-A mutase-associated GTPase MeaB [Alphaproteobacteria bacterium]|nr:methylmalonyl Co-A mutase-associated GTPase MeaB [Alphaproteobacteria bacterium]